ncbi:MAG: Ig-like domain-containing protein [Methanobacterium sp.]|nr:Ig-like domain-containing protein [Methanobacterium sp.]
MELINYLTYYPNLYGSLNILGESFTYKPNNDYNGQDTITYNFTDVLKHTSNLATLNIFIRSPPISDNIKISTKMNNPIEYNFKVKGYQSEPKILSLPIHGTIKLLENQKFSYTPNKDYHGTETFTYQAEDSLGQKSSPTTIIITTTKPPTHQKEPITSKNNHNNKLNNQDMNNPYKNLVNDPLLSQLNTTSSYLNITNLNSMNPANLMANPIITFINALINHIKNIINKIKL